MITRVEALYYKGMKYIDVDLRSFMLLVGANATGKSSFLDVLTLLRDLLITDPMSVIKKRCNNFKDLVWNQEKDSFEIALEMAIPAHISDKFKSARYEIALALNNEQEIVIQKENLFLINSKSPKVESKLIEQISLFPNEPKPPEYIASPGKKTPTGWRKVISKSSQGNDYFRSENSDWNIIYRFGPTKASLGAVPDDELRFPITLWIKKLLSKNIQFLQLNSAAMRWPCRPDLPVALEMDGSNLPKVIKFLIDKDLAAFNRWVGHIQSTLPEIAEIGIKEREADRHLFLYIKQNDGIVIPSWSLSDGTLRMLAQTILAYLPLRDQIYIIEEPENGLHPLAIESVYQSLSSLYDNQILLATHSPALLRLLEPKDILCFSKTATNIVDIISGDKHPKLKNWRRDVDLATLHAAGVLQ